jgi:hypothetical protein
LPLRPSEPQTLENENESSLQKAKKRKEEGMWSQRIKNGPVQLRDLTQTDQSLPPSSGLAYYILDLVYRRVYSIGGIQRVDREPKRDAR